MNRIEHSAAPTDVAFCRLSRAGWSIGDVCHGDSWLVTGNNGENVIRASASNQSGAWRIAIQQAEAVGMVRRE